MKRNVEEITHAREDEFYNVHSSLIHALTPFGRHGTSDADDFWIPGEVEGFREFYIILARKALLRPELLSAIRSVLSDCRFIWVVILHLGVSDEKEGPTDLRILEMTRSDVVIFEEDFRTLLAH